MDTSLLHYCSGKETTQACTKTRQGRPTGANGQDCSHRRSVVVRCGAALVVEVVSELLSFRLHPPEAVEGVDIMISLLVAQLKLVSSSALDLRKQKAIIASNHQAITVIVIITSTTTSLP